MPRARWRMSESGYELTKAFESLRLQSYDDATGLPVDVGDQVKGVCTIGYGHTRGVKPGDRCTEDQAMTWLVEDMKEAEDVLNTYVTVDLDQHQVDALADFVFNLGPGARGWKDGFVVLKDGRSSTILKKLNAGDYAGAAAEFPKWNLPPLPGLVRRRQAERKLFETGAVVV